MMSAANSGFSQNLQIHYEFVHKQARQVGSSRNEFLEAEENTKEVGGVDE